MTRLDVTLRNLTPKCYVHPQIMHDPEYPHYRYLDYGGRVKDWQDVKTFEKVYGTFENPAVVRFTALLPSGMLILRAE